MSYGIAAVIEEPKNSTDKIPFIFIGGFDGIAWSMYKDNPRKLQKLNNQYKQYLKKPNGFTTLEKLKIAPLDSVTIITGESSWKWMEDRKPLDCSKGSGNEKIYSDVKGYLTTNKYD